jgi:molybdopterin-guanine dinucleotide biosynthesis protein A
MGRDKATLPFGEETLLARVVRIVQSVVPDVRLVAREGQTLPEGFDAVRDPAEGFGPLAGLAAGLQALRTDRAFVAACDLPLLAPPLVRLLLDEARDADACVPRVGGFAMSACAVYRRELGPVAARLLERGERRLRVLLDRVRTRYIEADLLRTADPELASFTDCDTPEAYDRALRMAGLVATVRVEFRGRWTVSPPPAPAAVSGANLLQVVRALARAWPELAPEPQAGAWVPEDVAVMHRGVRAADPLTPVRDGETVRLIRLPLDAAPEPS